MSLDSLLPASCNAAIADAAVTPEVVEPCEKSLLPEVSFSSSTVTFLRSLYTVQHIAAGGNNR